MIKNWLIFILRILGYCFKIKTRKIYKETTERNKAIKIFNKYYPAVISYEFKLAETWQLGSELQNLNPPKLVTMARELTSKMRDYYQV